MTRKCKGSGPGRAGPGRRIAHRPGVTHHTHTHTHTHTTESSLSLQPNREVLFRASCNSTLASWRTEPNLQTGELGRAGKNQWVAAQRSIKFLLNNVSTIAERADFNLLMKSWMKCRAIIPSSSDRVGYRKPESEKRKANIDVWKRKWKL